MYNYNFTYFENNSGHGLNGLSISLVFSHTLVSFSESKWRFVTNVVTIVTIKLTPIDTQLPINMDTVFPVFVRNNPLPKPPGNKAE